MAAIKMTPAELRESANFLGTKREEILSAVEAVRSRVDSTTAEWEGAAQSSFVSTFNQMLPTLTQSFPQTIEGIEQMLKGAADTLEQADTEVARAFNG